MDLDYELKGQSDKYSSQLTNSSDLFDSAL